ncbi:MAG TPA: LytTR family DNA-binding domain-containing protein [Longimicrobiaceae bacterium]|nr:LytTR family DNA-binding domain-containing protein [Longimicrobiaceae bacterium]
MLARESREARAVAEGDPPYLAWLMVAFGGRIVLLRVGDVDWVQAEGNYVRLHVGERSCLIRETLRNLAERLDPRQFLRIHRSTIVNLERVQEILPWFAGNHLVVLRGGAQLQMTRHYRVRMPAEIGRYA